MKSAIQQRLRIVAIFFVAAIVVLVAASIERAAGAPSPQASGYHVTKKLPLGGEGGWDYLLADSANHRLFISRGTHVMVVDMETGKVTGDIPDTQGVHGIALAPEFNRGFTSNGRANTATILDLKTLATIGTVKTGENPDAILYDPASKRIFTFNGRSGDATAIDAASGEVKGTVPLGGKPETGVADGKGHIYVNVEDKSEVVAFDSNTLAVMNHWPLTGCEEPSGMAIDVKHRRSFSGCHNKVMAVLNLDTGKVVATPAIGAGVDANGFDPETSLAFSSNGDGTLTVVHQDSADAYTVVENVSTQPRARTMTLDLKTHIIYTVTAEFGAAPAATKENPRPRPAMVPNSFTVLVVSK
jgi:DNA-binding beta-propeller fold protein YncE